MERTPLLITVEGCEGSGKSTQIELFSPWFEGNYGPIVRTREPGGDPIAEKIREMLLDPANKGMADWTELLLYEAARASHVSQLIAPNLEQGISVVSDRFYDSTTAYQGAAREINLEKVRQMNTLAVTLDGRAYHPNLTIIIDVEPEVGLRNASKIGVADRLEGEPLEFHQRVRQGYLDIAKANPERVVVIPYQDGIEGVQSKIVSAFKERYKILDI